MAYRELTLAYDERLAARVRAHLRPRAGVDEKRMFGGVVFMLRGNMCCGVSRDTLIARLGPEEAARALAEPHTRAFDMTGRPMKAWVVVDPPALTTDDQLGRWVDRAAAWAGSLPPK